MSEEQIVDTGKRDEFMQATVTRGEMIGIVNGAVQAAVQPLRNEILDLKESIALHMQLLAASEGIMKALAARVGLAEEEMAAIGAKTVAVFDATLKAAMTEMHKAAAQMKVGKA